MGVVEPEPRRERATELAAEAVEWADRAVSQQRLGFRNFELAPGDDLPHPEVATLALEFLVLLVHLASAFRAARCQRGEVARNRVALVVTRLADNVLGHADD